MIQLNHISEILLLNGSLLHYPGLLYGKMGIVIFLLHYARCTGNGLFEDYAMFLIEKIQNQLDDHSPAEYANGIAGVGAGIMYLTQNGFVEADETTFADFDQRMYRAVMYEPCGNFSLYHGLTGYGKYWLMRQNPSSSSSSGQANSCLLQIAHRIEEKFPDIPANEQADVYCFLHDLNQVSGFEWCQTLLERCRVWDLQTMDFPRLSNSTVGNIARSYLKNRYLKQTRSNEMNVFPNQLPDLDMEKPPAGIGLHNGYAGEGILRLAALNHTSHSWINLL